MKKFLVCILALSILTACMISCSDSLEETNDSDDVSFDDVAESESKSESEFESESESESESKEESDSDIVFGEMTDDNKNWTDNY